MEQSYKTIIEYMKLHLISLEQDSEKVQDLLNEIDDMESDEYRFHEIEDISLNGQIMAIRHILDYVVELGLDKPLYEGV